MSAESGLSSTRTSEVESDSPVRGEHSGLASLKKGPRIFPLNLEFLVPLLGSTANLVQDPVECDFVLAMNSTAPDAIPQLMAARRWHRPIAWWTVEDPNWFASFLEQAKHADAFKKLGINHGEHIASVASRDEALSWGRRLPGQEGEHMGMRGRELVLNHHTYAHRLARIAEVVLS